MTITTEMTPESIPGTVHLVDLDHSMHTRHADAGAGDIVLVPTPSNDPNDPLNWSPRRKVLSSICNNLCVAILTFGMRLTWPQIHLVYRHVCVHRESFPTQEAIPLF